MFRAPRRSRTQHDQRYWDFLLYVPPVELNGRLAGGVEAAMQHSRVTRAPYMKAIAYFEQLKKGMTGKM
ncbi:hypothetical protein AMECASPLE_016718 [Ameca splendens]|uniref:Uncharacterized protein n=1 Tax=Ameca splendens TaxID=208324 RepID=A0ABV0Y265_9TELE